MKKSRINIINSFHWKTLFNRYTMDICLVFILSFLVVCISYVIMVRPYEPEIFAAKYVEYLVNKEYDMASACYIDIPDVIKDRPSEVIAALKEKYGSSSGINIKSIKKSIGSDICSVEFEVIQGGGSLADSFILHNIESNPFAIKKDWRVGFPFKAGGVTVTGTEGSLISIDGIEKGEIINGSLFVPGVLYRSHMFKSSISGVGESDTRAYDVNEHIRAIDLKIKPSDIFRSSMEKLVSDFCSGWSGYCLTKDPSGMKPYLTDSLYEEYTNNTDMFNESKYELCSGEVTFNELAVEGKDSISFKVDEKWHLKEVTTARNIVFKDNNKNELEQKQDISWEYHIIRDSGIWKIDSAEQIGFNQEILNK